MLPKIQQFITIETEMISHDTSTVSILIGQAKKSITPGTHITLEAYTPRTALDR